MSPREPGQLRHDLRAMSLDAAAFSVMVGIGESYLAAFALAVGVGQTGAGLLASVPPVAGAVLQLVSPAAVARLRSHRRWVVACAIVQALSFIPLVAGALLGRIPTWALFLLASLYWGSGMATGPAWNTWVSTLVPGRMRARYFSRRTRITQVGVLAGLVGGGLVLQLGRRLDQELHSFAVLFLIAAACRAVSSGLLASQSEPVPMPHRYRNVPAREAFARIGRRSHEGRLLLYLLSVQIAVHLSAPYFTPYMLKQLQLDYGAYMVLIAVSFAAKIFTLPALGLVAQRFGARRVLWIGGLGIVPLSALWLVSDSFAYLFVVQCIAGTFWGAYELATFLLVFEAIPDDERTSMLTSFNLANAIAMVGGSLVGGVLLHGLDESHSGYMTIFALSAAFRAVTVLLLLRVPAEVRSPVPIAVRTVAVRPSSGSFDRPILSSIDDRDGDDGCEHETDSERD
jgi:MFS family permease